MQQAGETDSNNCNYNNFALVRIAWADAAKVNPTIPYWGGPTGVDGNGAAVLESVYSYGRSVFRTTTGLAAKTGVVLQQQGAGWHCEVITTIPGHPNDVGSGFLSSTGEALGVLTTLGLLPVPTSNGVAVLFRALAYARTHGMPSIQLGHGTEPFNPAIAISR